MSIYKLYTEVKTKREKKKKKKKQMALSNYFLCIWDYAMVGKKNQKFKKHDQ